jgi:hypothetical protein
MNFTENDIFPIKAFLPYLQIPFLLQTHGTDVAAPSQKREATMPHESTHCMPLFWCSNGSKIVGTLGWQKFEHRRADLFEIDLSFSTSDRLKANFGRLLFSAFCPR